MAKNCANHSEAPSIGSCSQCGKPLCQQCTMITPMGQFCSTQCSTVYREMKKMHGGARKGGGGGAFKAVFVLLLLMIAAAFVVHFAAGKNEGLKKFDIIGRFIGQERK